MSDTLNYKKNGWKIFRVWEHRVKKSLESTIAHIIVNIKEFHITQKSTKRKVEEMIDSTGSLQVEKGGT